MNTDRNEISLCLHRAGDYWWMDGKCFSMLADYLKYYYHNIEGVCDISQIIFSAISKDDLTKIKHLVVLENFGQMAMLLSFPESMRLAVSDTICFEVCYENCGFAQVSKVVLSL